MAHSVDDIWDTEYSSDDYLDPFQPVYYVPPVQSSATDFNLQQPACCVPPVQAGKISSQDEDEDEALLSISFKWSESDPPQKPKRDLQRLFQSWFNKNEEKADCTVVKTVGDDCVMIEIKPVPAWSVLRKLHGQELTKKGCCPITITSVSLTLQDLDTDAPEEASMNPYTSISQPPAEQVEQSSTVSVVGEETYSCSVPVSLFWYVNHIYKGELKRMEKENGVTLEADVKVTFKPHKKDGDPEKAFNEFTHLIQDSLNESTGPVIPLKYVDPDQWSEALKIVQKNENKLLLTLSSDDVLVCGPSSSQNDFSRTLNAMQKTNMNAALEDYEWPSEETPLMIDMTINDPLVTSGLIIEESNWKLLTTSHNEQIGKIKATFNVDLRESGITQGKVTVKACYRGAAGNISIESHAVRALVRLYQSIPRSTMSLNQLHGATGVSRSMRNASSVYQSERASSGAVVNRRSGFSMKNSEGPTGSGATAGDDEDETCPICLDVFTKKQQLKCKHAFCKGCLQQAVESIGPMCPVCKDVFGVIEGDQPDGKITWISYGASLPVVNRRPGVSMKNTEGPTRGGATAGDDEDETCPICLDVFANKQQLKCKHAFCKGCLQQAKESLGPTCPVCKDVFGVIEGDQPDGKMTWITHGTSLPGFTDCGTIVITYDIPGGIQTGKHPKPGQYYFGINRTAYLPNNREGKEVVRLLKRAFDQKLIFTVGMSRTTGMDDQVTWNDISHKTSMTGGPQSFGYPDPNYLSRVKEELKAKGIK